MQGGLTWAVCREPPAEPHYEHFLGANFMLVPNQQHPPFDIAKRGIILSENEREAIVTEKAYLWLWGFLTFQDFIGGIQDFGFVARWEAVRAGGMTPRGFVLEGPSSYNYENQPLPKAPRTGVPPHLALPADQGQPNIPAATSTASRTHRRRSYLISLQSHDITLH